MSTLILKDRIRVNTIRMRTLLEETSLVPIGHNDQGGQNPYVEKAITYLFFVSHVCVYMYIIYFISCYHDDHICLLLNAVG